MPQCGILTRQLTPIGYAKQANALSYANNFPGGVCVSDRYLIHLE
jgi:hypothetical protein